MNIGYYTRSLGLTEVNVKVFEFLNKVVENNEVDSSSIFYDDIDFSPMPMKSGAFNSTDVWYFTGFLLVSGLNQVDSIKKVVNKFECCYVYDGDRQNLLRLISVFKNMNCIVTNKEDFDYINRVCGKEPYLLEEFTIDKIREISNEQKKSSQAV